METTRHRTDPDLPRLVGRRLAEARRATGLSQNDAARRLGVPQSRIARLETGARRLLLTEAVEFAALYDVGVRSFDPSSS